ncbi:zinc finger and SCAN domain-containing protein 2-like [Catharus ustulatus]|uniref:zinc finger and SCAN domain-containing protein 2-like n=1 Tax=Catharus ustulatus TaxID=91951 RepID=UPI00140B35EF|nr:zinc finger and SCAN domain-containing protein 2-like [Catharus ustulatus]
MESAFSIFQSPGRSDAAAGCPGDCVLEDNEEEKGFPEDLKQEELSQVHGAQSPERGTACDDSPHEKRDSRKVVLGTNDQKLHCKEKPFKCPECGKGFKGHCRLLTHLQIHAREKVFVCAECGKRFSRKANLVAHQRVHTGESLHKCKECEKTFSRASSLLAHHKTHLKKKTFSCTICRKNFGGNAALLQHQRVHTNEKPCRHSDRGNSFSVSSNFIRHQHLRERAGEHTADANQPEFTSLHQKEERQCGPEASEMDHWNLVSEELKKMRENMDMLLLNQQSQLQVLQEIQKQLNTLLPGNALLNSNVYSLGLLLGQQMAAAASISCPLLNPSSLLSCEGASALSLSPASGALAASQLPASQDPVASAARSALCCECVHCKHV